jgi:molybdenum cofactor cytidylyltransferase
MLPLTVATPAILLAAGSSRRLGRPKQTLLHEGETLIARTARIATEAGLSPILIVVTSQADFCTPFEAQGFHCIPNPDAAEGIASSIRCGIRVAQAMSATGAVLLACDQPTLTPAHLKKLIADLNRTTSSAYARRKGIPAYFTAAAFPDLLVLRGDTGARDLLLMSQAIPDESLAFDVDTEFDAFRLRP